MPPHTVAARTRHGTRPRPRPAPARRISGPLRPAPEGAAIRRGTTGVGGDGFRRGTTGVFERIRALPETRLVDGLLRGRVWIWLIGVLLGGIVAMQVSLLKLNAGISRAVTTTATLERQNANIEAEIARLSSGDRVREAAVADGMVTPLPGVVEYLRSRGERDATRAARLMQPPSEEAAAIMDNGGREPGVLAVAPVDPTATAADPATTDPATTDPATTDPATTTAAPPAETTTTSTPVDPATGAATTPGQE